MATINDARAELVRSRAFIRGAETQLSKALAALDAIGAEPDPSTPEPEVPEPEGPTPEPEKPDPPFEVSLGGALLSWTPYPDAAGYRVGFVSVAGSQTQTLPATMTSVAIPDGSPAGEITVTVLLAAGDGPGDSVQWVPPAVPESPAPEPESPVVVPPVSGATPLIEERFDYASTTAFLADPRGIYHSDFRINTGRISILPAGGMRYEQLAGRQNDYTISRALKLPDLRELWAEVAIQLSDGWTVNGNGQSGGASYKFLHIAIWPDSNGRLGLEWDNGDGGNSHMVGPNDAPSLLLATPYNVDTLRGGLKVFRYHARLSGGRAFHEAWLDGRHLGGREAESRADVMYALRFGANLNKQPPRTQTIDWRYALVYDRNPGW